jgi:osmotically-inducible protein OsmY
MVVFMTQTIHNSHTDLQANVTDELSYTAGIDSGRLGVAVKDGMVTLSGDVHSLPERHAAKQAAMRVFGVKAVTDTMVVRNPDASATEDTDIAEAAGRMLDWAVDVPANTVKASVNNHQITLSGTVTRQDQREAAARTVMYLKGVTGVTNSIVLTAPAPAADAKATIEAAFRRNAQLRSHTITVNLTGSEVTLRGNVRSWSERRQAERVAWAVSGVTNVKNDLMFSS